jgi:hypothetical protein
MLGRLAETSDPRVAVALAELAWHKGDYFHRSDSCDDAALTAEVLLMQKYFPGSARLGDDTKRIWDQKGGDLRRRAAQLPR